MLPQRNRKQVPNLIIHLNEHRPIDQLDPLQKGRNAGVFRVHAVEHGFHFLAGEAFEGEDAVFVREDVHADVEGEGGVGGGEGVGEGVGVCVEEGDELVDHFGGVVVEGDCGLLVLLQLLVRFLFLEWIRCRRERCSHT